MPAAAQDATAGADVEALVLRPFSLVKVEDLDFGSIIASASQGDVTVDPDGIISTTGGVILVGAGTHPARFVGQGSSNRVLIKSNSTQIFLTGPGAQMRLNQFTIGALSGLSQIGNGNNFRITSSNGIIGFSVGGTLRVNANQAEGLYSGTFSMTFNYQ